MPPKIEVEVTTTAWGSVEGGVTDGSLRLRDNKYDESTEAPSAIPLSDKFYNEGFTAVPSETILGDDDDSLPPGVVSAISSGARSHKLAPKKLTLKYIEGTHEVQGTDWQEVTLRFFK